MKDIILNNKISSVLIFLILVIPIHLNSKIFFVAAVLNFVYFSRKFENIFNPISVFQSMFMIMVGCSQVKLTPIEQDDFSLITWLCIFAVIFTFYIGSYIVYRKEKSIQYTTMVKANIDGRKLSYLNYIVLFVEAIIYIYIYIKVGGIPLQSDYLRANVLPKVISGYIMTLAIFPSYLIIINVLYYSITQNVKFLAYSFIYFFLILTLGGRINIFLPLGSALIIIYLTKFRSSKFNILKNKKIIIAMLAIIALLVMIPKIRTQEYSNHYYKNIYEYKQDEKAPESILPLWINFSTNLYAFDKLVAYVDANNDFQYGKMGLLGPIHFITKHFIPDKVVDFSKVWKIWLNVPTFMYFPYYDFGIFGVVGFTFLIAVVGMKIFISIVKKATSASYYVYAYFCTSLMLLIFVNHFLRSAFYIDIICILILNKILEKKGEKVNQI